ncbi:hypothetical protein Esi_0157_0006 [Ectocarpus siliculosus]|uniref:Uncharacterized protein n=1 Tax=Ectocarpus siliculosus TaxID=2880 RepID=D8LG28_ECTSI|nr:hypothetical protein Esi_0157_0006 [Ectocarpus siliculosus]|eukprot:CBN78927.1 hypothetical protein Esi_0157_0006 [Ectocarpus siliculosus]
MMPRTCKLQRALDTCSQDVFTCNRSSVRDPVASWEGGALLSSSARQPNDDAQERQILRQSPSCPATASTTVGLRSTTPATCLRAARLPFATTDDDEDGDARPASRGARPAAAGLVDSRRQTAAGALKAASGAGAGEGRDGDGRDLTAVRRALLLAIWLPFTIYAFGPWSPGATGDPKDIELVTHLYDGPVVPETAIFTAVFNALGFLPGIMASMLVGGGSFGKGRQPVPAPPFVFGAFALGFFSLGPYLAVRNYLPQAAGDEEEEMSTLEKVLTSKVLAVPLLAVSAYVFVSLVSALTGEFEQEALPCSRSFGSASFRFFVTARLDGGWYTSKLYPSYTSVGVACGTTLGALLNELPSGVTQKYSLGWSHALFTTSERQ